MSRLVHQKPLLNLRFQPFVGKQFVQFAGGVPHHTPADVFQISAGIDVEGSAGLNQGKQGGGRLAALFASEKEPVFSTDSKGADRPFGGIVVQPGRGMLCVALKE